MKSKQIKTTITAILMFITTFAFAQNGNNNLLGKWLTKDKVTLEFYLSGSLIYAKQTNAVKEKYKIDNGKLMAKSIILNSNGEFSGIMIDPDGGKEYKSRFIITADGKSLELKVKWGFMNFSETWTKL